VKVAIIGAGISGLVCASKLQSRHNVSVFEKSTWIGGHTHTIDVPLDGRTYAIDTGFIVFNERNYPNFTALLRKLGVSSQATQMTFGFSSDRTGLEYSGTSLDGLFAQRRNLLRPGHWYMLAEILRFFRCARGLLATPDESISLGDFLDHHQFSVDFREQHLLPMGAAIWSSPTNQMLDFPALSFARFFDNHGLLGLRDRPEWRVIEGGSKSYVDALSAPFRDLIRLESHIQSISRGPNGVVISAADGPPETFDAVVLACHSDEALAILSDATQQEKEVLGSIRYQRNQVTLHTDASVLPRNERATAAWNYRVRSDTTAQTTLTYHMNRLQGIDAPVPFLVTLNSRDAIDPKLVLGDYEYSHPIFDSHAIAAQRKGEGLGRENSSAFCGAYWGYGFHEDGVNSGLIAAEQIEGFSS
jgi:predicted NAD/FAD-binding protein